MSQGADDLTAHLWPDRFRSGLRVFQCWLGAYPFTQLGLFLTILALAALPGQTMIANMERVGITPGFAFLWRPANFEIGESLIAYAADSSFGRAILVGFLNTVMVSLAGCVLATMLGSLLGIAQLSTNPLLKGAVRTHVEVIRNTPLLLQLFFWIATIRALPGARDAFNPLPGVLLSNRGVFLPALRCGMGSAAGSRRACRSHRPAFPGEAASPAASDRGCGHRWRRAARRSACDTAGQHAP